MERDINHDENGKLIQMIKEKSFGVKEIVYIYRTLHYDIRYINSYSSPSYVEIIPRYKDNISFMDTLTSELASKFDEDSSHNPPLFYIDECYCYWNEVLEIKKQNPNKPIEKIMLNTFEQVEYVLSK